MEWTHRFVYRFIYIILKDDTDETVDIECLDNRNDRNPPVICELFCIVLLYIFI